MKDKLFLDTNVILDLLGERQLFYEPAAKILSLADKGQIKLVASALSFSTIFYLLSRFEDVEIVKEKFRKLKVLVETADLTDKIIEKGLVSEFSDFEDALQYHCALETGCKIIITRDSKGFKSSVLPVLSPVEYLKSLSST